jgi:dedicator of cytokinesis protein 1
MNKHSHNVLLSVHNFISKVNEDTELLFALYDGDDMKAITESYVIKWNRTRMSLNSDQYNNSVLFTDLSTQDLNRNKTYLVAYIVRIGMMDFKDSDSKRLSHTLLNSKKSNRTSTDSLTTAEQMRRPFGVAAFDLTPILKSTTELRSDSQMQMTFLQCEKENLESTLRKLITSKDTSKSDSSIWISLDLLHGDIKQVKEDNPHLVKANVPFARKMGFPEVIFPGDVRNDLYVSMLEGEFTKGKKTSDKNVEVTACVCNEKGTVMQDLIAKGAANMVSEFKSVIYYHEDRPKWHEIFKVDVPIEDFKQCHLRFTFKHRSTNETKDRTEKPFGLSYVKLCHENGTTIQDKIHKLLVYKIDYKKYEDTQYNYLQLPAVKTDVSSNAKPTVAGFSVFSKDSFTIGTNLCSTKLTQDGE